MARPQRCVVIVSELHWAFWGVSDARPWSKGQNQRRCSPPLVRRIPLLRGLARFGLAFAPLMPGGATSRRIERLGLFAALLLPFGLVLVSQQVALAVGFVVTAFLFFLLFRGRTLALHCAEHRADRGCLEPEPGGDLGWLLAAVAVFSPLRDELRRARRADHLRRRPVWLLSGRVVDTARARHALAGADDGAR